MTAKKTKTKKKKVPAKRDPLDIAEAIYTQEHGR